MTDDNPPIGPPVLPGDWDGDGVSDAAEHAAGTDPYTASSEEDRRAAMAASGIYDKTDDSPDSIRPELERIAYVSGLWFEGIVKGAALVLPPLLLVAMVTGITMGILRLGVRGTERFFTVCRKE